MASYHFPILVGTSNEERVVMVHLFDNSPHNYLEKRVIFTTTPKPLFKVQPIITLIDRSGGIQKGQLVITAKNKEGMENYANNICEVAVSVQIGITNAGSTNQSVSLSTTASELDNSTTLPLPYIELGMDDHNYTFCKGQNILEDELIKLTFTTKIDEKQFKGELHLIICSNASISYTNIDLGSDVTQATNYLGENFPKHIPLIDRLKKDLSYKGNKNEYLSQYYEGNNEFYRTGNILFKRGGVLNSNYINYLSLNLEGANKLSDKEDTELSQEMCGNIVTSTDSSEYQTFPNIKVLYKQSNENTSAFDGLNQFKKNESSLTSEDLDQRTFCLVLTEIYKELIKITTKANDEKQKHYESVLLLVPNIYRQFNVDKLLYDITCAMNNNIETQTTYYDFRAMSESDAAFLGGVKYTKIKGAKSEQKDLYLVIDSGRGTTDFSIISRSDDNTFTALRRGGIVGAGGAIDTLFSYIYAKHLYKNRQTEDSNISLSSFQRNFMIWFCHLPSGPKEQLRLEIEKLKIDNQFRSDFIKKQAIYNINNGIFDQTDSNNQLPFVFNAEETVLPLDDKDNYWIDNLCNKIAKETMNLICKDNETDFFDAIDHVIYSGRAFQFNSLKNAFETIIDTYRIGRHTKKGSIIKNLFTNKTLEPNLRPTYQKSSKKDTVKFKSHNFNINLNSDICCLQDLLQDADLNKKDEREFSLDQLFNGRNGIFYLGYYGDEQVWTSNINPPEDFADSVLTIMTLFPNKVIDVRDFKDMEQLFNSQQ